MARAQSRSILAMKILMEQDQVFPVRIVLKLLGAPVHCALPIFLAKEDIDEPSIDLERNLEQRHHSSRTSRALDQGGSPFGPGNTFSSGLVQPVVLSPYRF